MMKPALLPSCSRAAASVRFVRAVLAALWLSSVLGAAASDRHSAATAAGPGHVHGQARLDAIVEGRRLRIEVELPMEALTGFERAPRSDDERERLAGALEALRSPGLLRPNADAGCSHAGHRQQWTGNGTGALTADDAHTDLMLTHEFDCAQPARLSTIEIGLFDRFSRLRRIEARVAGPAGTLARTLARNRRVLELTR